MFRSGTQTCVPDREAPLNLLKIPAAIGRSVAKGTVSIYQRYISKDLNADNHAHCMYTPSCSHYMQEALDKDGVVRGTMDIAAGLYLHAFFAFINGALLGYALGCFIGFREIAEDLGLLLPLEESPGEFATDPIEPDAISAGASSARGASASMG